MGAFWAQVSTHSQSRKVKSGIDFGRGLARIARKAKVVWAGGVEANHHHTARRSGWDGFVHSRCAKKRGF